MRGDCRGDGGARNGGEYGGMEWMLRVGQSGRVVRVLPNPPTPPPNIREVVGSRMARYWVMLVCVRAGGQMGESGRSGMRRVAIRRAKVGRARRGMERGCVRWGKRELWGSRDGEKMGRGCWTTMNDETVLKWGLDYVI
ncbi:hypothetical protein Tco_1081572 [Tanacetum coccineum]|uniref:Uncharacterized protein n=1 Tax=Tanacetum coccineum TaxID=301880 RepID=A0ABQ5HZL0_9ASTR